MNELLVVHPIPQSSVSDYNIVRTRLSSRQHLRTIWELLWNRLTISHDSIIPARNRHEEVDEFVRVRSHVFRCEISDRLKRLLLLIRVTGQLSGPVELNLRESREEREKSRLRIVADKGPERADRVGANATYPLRQSESIRLIRDGVVQTATKTVNPQSSSNDHRTTRQ